jgi:hypothetical protein
MNLLIHLVIILVVCGGLYWAVNMAALPPKAKRWGSTAVAVILVIWLLRTVVYGRLT